MRTEDAEKEGAGSKKWHFDSDSVCQNHASNHKVSHIVSRASERLLNDSHTLTLATKVTCLHQCFNTTEPNTHTIEAHRRESVTIQWICCCLEHSISQRWILPTKETDTRMFPASEQYEDLRQRRQRRDTIQLIQSVRLHVSAILSRGCVCTHAVDENTSKYNAKGHSVDLQYCAYWSKTSDAPSTIVTCSCFCSRKIGLDLIGRY